MTMTEKRWQSAAGPIQTKRVKEALNAISREGSTYDEVYGVTGVSESRSTMWSPFSPPRAEAVATVERLGDEFRWTITRDNYQAIVERAHELLKELKQSRPVKDERRTPEQDAELSARIRQADQERDQAATAKAEAVSKHAAELRQKYPWAIPAGEKMTRWARAAANAKLELGQLWPGVAFSVRSESYSGGDAIRVEWELGPTAEEVAKALEHYREGHFDGMTDSYEYDSSVSGEAVGAVLGRVRHVSCSRTYGHSIAKAAQLICELRGLPWGGLDMRLPGSNNRISDEAYTLLATTSIQAGAEITGIEAVGDANTCRLRFEIPQLPCAPEQARPLNETITVRYNAEHDGVELAFELKPTQEQMAAMKASGFRCTRRPPWKWYKRYSAYTWQRAHELAGISDIPSAPHRSGAVEPDRFDMAVEDQMAETCGLVGEIS